MADDSVLHLTAESFSAEVLEADIPVLVDFWAAWCGPCRMLAPIIDDIAAQQQGIAKICKLDVDAHGALAARFGVMSIPTVIIFKGGKETERFVGVQPKDVLIKALG